MKRAIVFFVLSLILAGCNTRNNSDDFLIISPEKEIFFESEASNTKLTISCNNVWNVGNIPDWCSITPASGGKESEITVSVYENTGDEIRTAEIIISCGNASESIRITQYGKITSNYMDLGLDNPDNRTSYDEESGILNVTYGESVPAGIRVGQSTVLPAKYGFDIRVIDHVSTSGNSVTIETSQGNMTNLFRNTSFILSTDPTTATKSIDGRRVITPASYGFIDEAGVYREIYNKNETKNITHIDQKILECNLDFSGGSLYDGKAGKVYWKSFKFGAGLNGTFAFDFGSKQLSEEMEIGDLNYFSYQFTGTSYIDLQLAYQMTAFEPDFGIDKIIDKNIMPSLVFTFIIGGVPVIISTNVHFGLQAQIKAEGAAEISTGANLSSSMSVGLEWRKDSGVSPITNFDSNLSLYPPEISISASTEAILSYYPRLELSLYKFIGPIMEIRPYLALQGNAGSALSADTDYAGWKLGVYSGTDLNLGLNLDFGIVGWKLWEKKINVLNSTLFQAPMRLTKLYPEDNLLIKEGESITAEFIVEYYNAITDLYYPCPGALVAFKTDSGTLSRDGAISGMDGKVSIEWTPEADDSSSEKRLTTFIVDGENNIIDASYLNVTIEKQRPTPGKCIDLGLSVKWAGWNIGASSPEGTGSRFAWGAMGGGGTWASYPYFIKMEKNEKGEEYAVCENIGSDISGTSYDAARELWEAGWRIPRKEEFNELISYCSWEWGNHNGVAGLFAIGPNGNSIFLPAAGGKDENGIYNEGNACHYWTSTLSSDWPECAYRFNGTAGGNGFSAVGRYGGYPIRAVTK